LKLPNNRLLDLHFNETLSSAPKPLCFNTNLIPAFYPSLPKENAARHRVMSPFGGVGLMFTPESLAAPWENIWLGWVGFSLAFG